MAVLDIRFRGSQDEILTFVFVKDFVPLAAPQSRWLLWYTHVLLVVIV